MFGFFYQLADGLRHHVRRRKWPSDLALGRRGEDIAHRHLQRAGIVIVARNYRTPSGTGGIDLIGWDHGTLVFFEVKSRSTDEYGAPDRAIGDAKRDHIVRAARQYVRHAEAPWESVRFDVVNVVFRTPPVVTHYKDVFHPESKIL
jgi:putative endonuclease